MAAYKNLSTTGTGLYEYNLTEFLKSNEVIATFHIRPDDSTLLKIGPTRVNTATYTDGDAETVAIGKGLLYEVSSNTLTPTTAYVIVDFVGNKGSTNSLKKAIILETNIVE